MTYIQLDALNPAILLSAITDDIVWPAKRLTFAWPDRCVPAAAWVGSV